MTARNSKLNRAAIISACVFAVGSGLTGHFAMSAMIALFGAALCFAIILREPI